MSRLLGLALAFAYCDADFAWFTAAGDADWNTLANAVSRQSLLKLLNLPDLGTVDGQDHVAKHQASGVGGSAGLDGDDEQTLLLTILENAGEGLR